VKIGCYKLGELYSSGGKFVDMDISKALLYFRKACDLGQREACKRIGDYYRDGTLF